MKSQEFYKLFNKAFKPECSRLGFSKIQKASSMWTRRIEAGTIIYQVSISRHYPYVPYVGGRFDVRLDLIDSPDPKARTIKSRISYLEYFSDKDLIKVQHIRDSVISKIASQKDFDHDSSRSMWEIHVSMLEFEAETEIRRHQLAPMPYVDAQDINTWATFLAGRLEATLQGVSSNPIFMFQRK